MRTRTGTIALVAVGCALALAGCGSSKGGGTSQSSLASAGLKFATCMRAHGVPNFPDPNGGGGIQIPIGSGINPQSPAFQSARGACAKLLPGGGPGGQHASEQDKLRMLKMSQCMRNHGLTTFPDPVATPPQPGGGLGLAFGSPGSFIVIPQSLMQSPAFNQAARACGLPGAGVPRKRAAAG
jgi:hypothetical protein